MDGITRRLATASAVYELPTDIIGPRRALLCRKASAIPRAVPRVTVIPDWQSHLFPAPVPAAAISS